MLLLAIAIVIFFVIYQKRLMTQQEKLLRLEFEYQKDLVNSSIQTQEVERKRIAADLHDSIGSQLSATKLYLRQLLRNPEKSEEYQQQVKREAMELLEETILNVRQITHDLLPLSLERFGLVAALEDLVDRYNELGEGEVQFDCREERRFEVEKEVAFYRIIQELFNNTLKHARAQRIELSLQFRDSQVHLQYQDDGVGFDFPTRHATGKSRAWSSKASRAAPTSWPPRCGSKVHLRPDFSFNSKPPSNLPMTKTPSL